MSNRPEDTINQYVVRDERIEEVGKLKGLKELKLEYDVGLYMDALHYYKVTFAKQDLEYILLSQLAISRRN
jgi:hypothetical protein